MATDANSQVNRRGFLKGAAAGAAGAAALTVPGVAPAGAGSPVAEPARPASFTPEQAARTLASETAPLPEEPDVQTSREDPGSDFMVDVLKTWTSNTSSPTRARASAVSTNPSSTTAATRLLSG